MHTARWYTRPNAAMLTRSRLADASSSGTARSWAWTAIDSVRRSTNPVSIYLRLQATSLTFLPRPLRRLNRPSKEVRDERSLLPAGNRRRAGHYPADDVERSVG